MKGVGLLLATAAVCWFVQPSSAADILALFPHEGRSHWIVFRELMVELSKRGHKLTIVTHFPEDGHNWEVIHLKTRMGNETDFNFLEFGALSSFEEFMMLFHVGTDFCRRLMEDVDVVKLINSRDRKFDLIVMETFFHDCLLAFAHKFKAPLVTACALGGGASWVNDIVGSPYPSAYIPEATVPYTTSMSFVQRAHNSFVSLGLRLYRQKVYFPILDQMVRERFKDPNMPPLADLERSSSLLLLNTHFSFDYPRPLVPNAVQVAGMHIRPPKKLPQELQTFMDGATNGVVYFSMGSGIKSSNFPEEIKKVFLKVFSKLKQKVLWKYEKESLPNLPVNVKIGKWLPQNDILAHKNLKLFITHGGMMSLQESLYSGVPLLGFPIFGDQESNLLKAQNAGFAIMIQTSNLTEESISWAINELLTNSRYMENAKKYSQLFHDRPEKPLDTAVYWIEYVLRHRGAYHLRSAALDLTWYQYLLLDVFAILLVSALSALVAVIIVIKLILRIFLKSGDSSQNKKKRTKNE